MKGFIILLSIALIFLLIGVYIGLEVQKEKQIKKDKNIRIICIETFFIDKPFTYEFKNIRLVDCNLLCKDGAKR